MSGRLVLACLVFAASAIAVSLPPVNAADQTSTWDQTTGDWSDATKWDTAAYPNNGNGGVATYDAVISSGTVNLDLDITIEHLLLSNGAVLAGSEDLTLNGGLTLNQGQLAGTGITTVAAGGTLSIGGFETLGGTGLSTTLVNEGTAQTTADGRLFIRGNSAFINNGQFNAGGEFQIANGTGSGVPRFDNNGTLIKTGAGTVTELTPDLAFNSAGQVTVGSGELRIGGGDSSGRFDVADGATLAFYGGTQNLLADSEVVVAAGGTASFGGYSNDDLVNIGGGYDSAGATTFLKGAEVNFNTGETVNVGELILSNGSVIGGADNLTASSIVWGDGTLAGTGTTTVSAAGTLSLTSNAKLGSSALSNMLVNDGTAQITTDSSGIFLIGDTALVNNGQFNAVDASRIRKGNGDGAPEFTNNGTFTKTGAETVTSVEIPQFNNNGVLDVLSGQLLFSETNFQNATTITVDAADEISFSGAHVRNEQSGSIIALAALNFGSGTIDNEGLIEARGGNVSAGSTISNSGRILVTNDGNFTQTGDGFFTFTNAGVVEVLDGSATIARAINLTVNNSEPVARTTLSGGTWIVGSNSTLEFERTSTYQTVGSIDVNDATVRLIGPGAQIAGPLDAIGFEENDGTLEVSNGATMLVRSSSLPPGVGDDPSPFINRGALMVGAGSTITADTYGIESRSGSTIQGTGTIAALLRSKGATFSSTGTLTVDELLIETGTTEVASGTVGGNIGVGTGGRLHVASGAGLTGALSFPGTSGELAVEDEVTVNSLTLSSHDEFAADIGNISNGVVNVTGTTSISQGSRLNLATGTVLKASGGVSISNGTIAGTGTLQGDIETYVGATFRSEGTLTLDGDLNLNGGDTYFTEGTVLVNGPTNIDGGTVTIDSVATLAGPGSLLLNNGQIILQGTLAKRLIVSGQFVMAGISNGALDLNGANVDATGGASFGLVDSYGNNSLDNGTLDIGGQLFVNPGTLSISAGASMQSTGDLVVIPSAAFVVEGEFTSQNEAVITGHLAIDTGGHVTTAKTKLKPGSSAQVSGNLATDELSVQGTLSVIATGSIDASNITVFADAYFGVNGQADGAVKVEGGGLGGGGTFTGTISLETGVLSPGNSPGKLTTGSVDFAGGAVLELEVRDAMGASGVDYDLLNVNGNVVNEGSAVDPMVIRLVSLDAQNEAGLAINFNPSLPQSWEVVTATGAITGFDPGAYVLDTSQFLNPIGGGTFDLTVAPGGQSLLVDFTPGLPGDFDGDDDVDGADFLTWQREVGAGLASPANLNGDNVVDGADLGLWRDSFGESIAVAASLPGSQGVPEPGTVVLVSIAALLGLVHRRLVRCEGAGEAPRRST